MYTHSPHVTFTGLIISVREQNGTEQNGTEQNGTEQNRDILCTQKQNYGVVVSKRRATERMEVVE